MFVHGQEDELIDSSHSEKMMLLCGGHAEIVLPLKMNHNRFDFNADLVEPFKDFLYNQDIDLCPKNDKEFNCFKSNQSLFEVPESILREEKI